MSPSIENRVHPSGLPPLKLHELKKILLIFESSEFDILDAPEDVEEESLAD